MHKKKILVPSFAFANNSGTPPCKNWGPHPGGGGFGFPLCDPQKILVPPWPTEKKTDGPSLPVKNDSDKLATQNLSSNNLENNTSIYCHVLNSQLSECVISENILQGKSILFIGIIKLD